MKRTETKFITRDDKGKEYPNACTLTELVREHLEYNPFGTPKLQPEGLGRLLDVLHYRGVVSKKDLSFILDTEIVRKADQ